MESDQHQAAIPVGRRFASIAVATVSLVAFWLLLGYRFSPEGYSGYPFTPGTVELIWIGLGLAAAVSALVLLYPRREYWPVCARAAIPLAVVSLVILAKTRFHAPLYCYDVILFCASFGFGVFWSTKEAHLFATGWEDNTARTRMAGLVVWTSVLLLGAYYVRQQLWCWNNLALGNADCGLHASILYNTVSHPRELFLGINPNMPMFWDHFYPGVIAFVPLWLLWPDFKLVIVLQVVVIVGVALPLYGIGKHLFKEETATLLLVLAWLAYPSTSQIIFSGSYGFRWGNVCLPLYFFALLSWMKGRKGWALAAAIGALSMKEEAAVVIGMFGLYLAIFERRPRLGLAITAVALGYFLIVTKLIIPRAQLGYYVQERFFEDLGQNLWQILLSPLLRPRLFWAKLFESRSWYFAAALLAPLLFLPLKKPSILFVGLLTFAFDCMHPILKSISYHYQAALLPVVFWALAAALEHKPTSQRRAVLIGTIASGVMLSLFLGNTFWSKDTIPIRISPGRLELAHRISRQIKESDTLIATQRIAAHYIKQRRLYVDPPFPADIDYALLDLQDQWRTVNVEWLGNLRDLQRRVEQIPGLHLVAAEDGLLLYGRRDPPLNAQALVERNTLPPGLQRQIVELDHEVRIEGFTLDRVSSSGDPGSDVVRVTIYSTVEAPTNTDLAVRCAVQVGGGSQESDSYASPFKPLGQGIWPIVRWETNKFYVDDFSVTLPAGLSAQITGVGFEAAPLSP